MIHAFDDHGERVPVTLPSFADECHEHASEAELADARREAVARLLAWLDAECHRGLEFVPVARRREAIGSRMCGLLARMRGESSVALAKRLGISRQMALRLMKGAKACFPKSV